MKYVERKSDSTLHFSSYLHIKLTVMWKDFLLLKFINSDVLASVQALEHQSDLKHKIFTVSTNVLLSFCLALLGVLGS